MQPNTQEVIATAQRLVDAGVEGAAKSLIEAHGLKLIIRDGRVVDQDDLCQVTLDKFVTVNPEMLQLKEDVKRLSPIEETVLISGPTGTGKELIAKALHGRRPESRFKAVNCAGLPLELVESELFGHVQGAFTGANRTKEGMMKMAEDGTIFLDEISELPMQAQGKLLRALQEKRTRKVGSNTDEQINCRFVCATNRDLEACVKEHTFRIDLFARISTFELKTTDLAWRREDIIPIFKSYGADQKLIDHIKKEWIDSYPDAVLRPLSELIPFNVRSIQQHVKRYHILGKLP